MRRPPCATCPWRIGSNADAIPGFQLDMAIDLGHTCSGEIGAPVFACHLSREDEEFPCAGWLAIEGHASITARILVMAGRIDHGEVAEPPPEWPPLYRSFGEMFDNLRETFTGVPTPEAAAAHAKMVERAREGKVEDGPLR